MTFISPNQKQRLSDYGSPQTSWVLGLIKWLQGKLNGGFWEQTQNPQNIYSMQAMTETLWQNVYCGGMQASSDPIPQRAEQLAADLDQAQSKLEEFNQDLTALEGAYPNVEKMQKLVEKYQEYLPSKYFDEEGKMKPIFGWARPIIEAANELSTKVLPDLVRDQKLFVQNLHDQYQSLPTRW